MARTLLTLSFSGAVFLGALGLKDAIRATLDESFEAFRYDMTAALSPSQPGPALEGMLGSIPGVAAVQAWGGGSAAVVGADGTWGNTFGITAVPPDSRFLAFTPVEGRWMRPDGREIVVGARLRESQPALVVGDSVPLLIAGRTTYWRVVGIVTGLFTSAYVSRESWSAVTGDTLVNRAAIVMADSNPVARAEARRLIHEHAREAGLNLGSAMIEENRSSATDHLIMVVDFLSAMGWLMLVVGGLGLASTMSIAVLERTREIGVLRAIGARHGAIHLIVHIEGLVIALASWLLAIPLSAPVGGVLGAAFGRIFFKTRVPMVPDLPGVAVWLLVVAAVSLAACAWPAFRATRISARAALAYE